MACRDDASFVPGAGGAVQGGGGTGGAGGAAGAAGAGGAVQGGGGAGGAGGAAKKPDGVPCGAPGECQSGHCVDEVCCAETCAGKCLACSQAKTGGKSGACGPVVPGTDPDGECAPGVCDGLGACAAGNHLWSKRFGDASRQVGLAIAADASGNVLVTGSFQGTADFGGGPLTSAGDYDIFVAKLDQDGKHLWSKRFGDSSDQGGNAIAADASGNVLVTGAFNGTADFGGGPLACAGDYDIFVAKLAP